MMSGKNEKVAPLTVMEIKSLTNGELVAVDESLKNAAFTAVCTDTRKIKQGDLFIALKGEKFDGTDFAREAVKRGATGVIVNRDCPAEKIAGIPLVIKVYDPLAAYHAIAQAWRSRFAIPIIAVTGSNGKTTTKDLTACVLASRLNVLKTQANFNNEIGLAQTVLNIDATHDAAVVEMGMRGFGQIDQLAMIANPTIGIVTNVGETHIELLGSIENIAKAKSELIHDLPIDGTAILNADDKHVAAMAEIAPANAKIITYGIDNAADVRVAADSITTKGLVSCFNVVFSGEKDAAYQAELPLVGRHNIYNALAALAAGFAVGLKPQEMIEALAGFTATGSRFEMKKLGGWTVIDDAYNASPASMTAALNSLAGLGEEGTRRIAVLGDMLELGAIAEKAHEAAGKQAARFVDGLIVYGEMAQHIADGAIQAGLPEEKIYRAKSHEAAAEYLKEIHTPNDIILFKGSHGMQMGKIIELLN